MRIQKWPYPTKKWVRDNDTGLYHSRTRTPEDIESIKQSISDMTFVPVEEISWNNQHHYAQVIRP